ncbi:phospholipase D family protein [Shewanella youngdeokensis]|uniref:Phospholipase D family protein n=1 Tax=Shewanella youngdeokensis TaxID=2999068 RepID=A0ABZ0K1G2_9GAMM|nr:phospholipase D family protein [Shewanella sp. DAU334]
MKAAGSVKLLFSKKLLLCAALVFLFGCQSTPQYPDKTPTYAFKQQTQSALFQSLKADLETHSGLTGVVPLSDGVDALIARLALVKAATSSIDLQYYIYRADESGKLLLWHLLEAAERGVRVRLLLDDMALKGADNSLVMLVSHHNIDVRLYNPSFERHFRTLAFINHFSRLNHRMHNKSLTIDNTLTVVGGRNIGNEYFSNNADVDFGDFDLVAVGDVVNEVSQQFDLYWNADLTVDINALTDIQITTLQLAEAKVEVEQYKLQHSDSAYIKRLLSSQLIAQIEDQTLPWYWGKAQLVYDQPDKQHHQSETDNILADLSLFLAQAKRDVIIVSPYFVPTRAGAASLIKAVESGLEVTVITNSLAATDVLAVHAGYRTYRQQLLEAGVKLYEVKADLELSKRNGSSWSGSSKSSLHAKTFIIDSSAIFVGSFNFDPRSAWLNTEMGLIIKNQTLATGVFNGITDNLVSKTYRLSVLDDEVVWHNDETQQVMFSEPDSGLWRQFLVDCIALLPIESQL